MDLEAVISGAISEGGSTESAPSDTPDTGTESADSGEVIETAAEEAPVEGAEAPAAPAQDATDRVSETPEAPEGVTPPEDSLETLQQELAGKRDNRIPYSRVTKIVQNSVKKAVASLEAELAPFRSEEFQNTQKAMALADESPDKFLALLAEADPRYAQLLQGAAGLVKGAPGKAGKAAPAAPAGDDGDVQPNIQLSDGTLGYDAAAVNQLVNKALERQAQSLRQEFDTRLGDYKPLREEYETRVLRGQAVQKVTAQLEEAQQWPGFAGSEQEIAAAMQKNPKLDLKSAYIQVVLPKFQADEAKVRAKIAAENKLRAKASSGVAPGAAAAPSDASVVPAGMDPIEAAIHGALNGIK